MQKLDLLLQASRCRRSCGRRYVMHQPWDQVPTDLRYGPPVAKASRRSYQPDLVDKGFLDFLLADNAQLPAAAPPPQQQSPFDLAYGSNQIGAQAPSAVYDDGPFMSQQHTFQWVPTPGAPGISRASDSLPASDTAQTGPSEPLGESVGHKHKRMEEAANSGQANDDFGLGTSAAQLQHSGEHSGSDFEDNKKLTKAERTARMREKNKTAQKRWRDRQKVFHTTTWGRAGCHACISTSYVKFDMCTYRPSSVTVRRSCWSCPQSLST